jgi:hypothetical protein
MRKIRSCHLSFVLQSRVGDPGAPLPVRVSLARERSRHLSSVSHTPLKLRYSHVITSRQPRNDARPPFHIMPPERAGVSKSFKCMRIQFNIYCSTLLPCSSWTCPRQWVPSVHETSHLAQMVKLVPKRSPISSGHFSLLCLKFKRWFLSCHLLLLCLTGHLFRSSTVERLTSVVSFFSGQRVRTQYRVTKSYRIARV